MYGKRLFELLVSGALFTECTSNHLPIISSISVAMAARKLQ